MYAENEVYFQVFGSFEIVATDGATLVPDSSVD